MTDPVNDDSTTIFIAVPNLFVHIILCKDLKLLLAILCNFIVSDEMIHRDLELLTITFYTAVVSGFDPQGVTAEKPRHPPTITE